jgi:integrase/recombinase XerD
MSDLTPSGTPERENMERCESLAAVLDDYRAWIDGQGFSKGSATDHTTKLTHFWPFLTRQGLLTQDRVQWLDIDRDVIAEYQAHIFQFVSRVTGKRLSCNSQINYLSYLQTFFRFLHKTKRVALNPTDTMKLPRHPHLLPAVLLKPDEMRRLLAMPNVETVIGFRDRTILEVFWSTAPRLSEMCGVEVEDLNFDEGMLLIREGKGQRERVLPIGEGAMAWTREYLRAVRPLLRRHRRAENSNALFLNRSGQRITKGGWDAKMRVYTERARLNPLFTTHTFRHQLASDMLRNGADLRHIQQMLGHESLVTTQRYLHVVKGDLLKVHAQTHPKEKLPVQSINYHGGHED